MKYFETTNFFRLFFYKKKKCHIRIPIVVRIVAISIRLLIIAITYKILAIFQCKIPKKLRFPVEIC